MPSKQLTEQAIAGYKPKAKQYAVYDSVERHLLLKIGKNSKAWRVVYKNAEGKRQSEGIGHWPDLDVKNARIKAAAFKVAKKEKVQDPASPNAAILEPTFREIAETYFKRAVDGKNLRSARQMRRYFDTIIFPVFGAKEIASIQRADITEFLDTVEDERGRRTAELMLAYIRRFFNWHQARANTFVNPIVRGMLDNEDRRRDRVLNDAEIRVMWSECEKLGTFGRLVKLLLITAQRRAKCATMKWTDVSDGVWTIAKEKREKGNADRIRLPQIALDVIADQPAVFENDYIFASVHDGGGNGSGRDYGSFNAFGKNKKALDKLMLKSLPDMQPWRLHDLRRTARTLMSKAKIKLDICERVLGHARDSIVETYDVYDYEVEKTEALEKLAALIAVILDPPPQNVIQYEQREVA